MGFSSEEVLAEISSKLRVSSKCAEINAFFDKFEKSSNGAKSSEALVPRLAEALLSKAPKQFLTAVDSSEFSEVVCQTAASLTKLVEKPEAIFIDSFVGADLFYISVVIKDCPFIINTYNNILKQLGFSAAVTLHPIITVGEIPVSSGVLVFSGIDKESGQAIVDSLARVVPLLLRVCADFQPMKDLALDHVRRISECGDSLWYGEVFSLIRWFIDGGLILIATVSAKPENKNNFSFDKKLGILNSEFNELSQVLEEIKTDYNLFRKDEVFRLSKLTITSPVHYPRRLLHIALRNPVSGEMLSILGSLTSRAISEEAATMPLVRLKLKELVNNSQVAIDGHDHKAIIRLINGTPKHHLLSADTDSLGAELKMFQDVEFLGHSLARLNVDESGRGVFTVVGLLSSGFNSEMRRELQTHLEQRLSALDSRSDVYLTSLNDAVVRFYFYTPLPSDQQKKLPSPSLLSEIARELSEISLGWSGRLQVALEQHFGKKATAFLQKYQSAFTSRYKALTAPVEAVSDILLCERISENAPVRVRYDPYLKPGAAEEEAASSVSSSLVATVSIVKSGQQLTMGKTLPILENMGFEVIDSETLELKLSSSVTQGVELEKVFLHRFFVRQGQIRLADLSHFNEVVTPALEKIVSETFDNDSLNSLLISANLNQSAVTALRVYYNLLWQIRKTSSRLALRASLTNNPKAAALLWQLFRYKFDPSLKLSLQQRVEEFDKIWLKLQEQLKTVKDILDDSNLKGFGQLIVCTLRTNFFENPSHYALKIHSEKLPLLRGAKPMYETYVHGPEVEGVHLRSSKVSRGGLRWSDRREDYRTEVLGLMRVQRIKNAIVVPGGAKGGFIVRDSGRGQPSKEVVLASYREFIRALLSLADNLVDGKPVSPNNIIIYDDSDPYLVVAADKGTASFSDYANQIAVDEYDFWLNDGFASGGSKGYGHKELGITARGAWECVKQHFNELNLDYEKTPFSVVGIGDMSGDVFGNGLLLSRQMKLIAAFDHRHVFIDPCPDLERAFEERSRLFALPRSSWADYDPKLLSEGGGIYGRLDKDIVLSPQARLALGIADAESGPFTGEQIISHALKAPVDLLWNGGIGTYVKSSSEVDSEVNDSANDSVRISASELRAKVVGEGGNVGFTQAARVEFSIRGGRINTDSIDNSAGVDLSDHEVNLKILFQKLQSAGLCSREERDLLFKEMSDEVAAAALAHNRNQAFVISVAERASKKSLDYFRALIRELCNRSYLTRVIDGLPSDDELEKRAGRRIGMTRPEIAICLAGMKLWLKDEIMRSGIAMEPVLQHFSIGYFPNVIQQRFQNQLLSHPLLPNITTAELANHLVDLVGITFIHRLQLSEGVEIEDALRASIAASLVVMGREFLEEIELLHGFETRDDYLEARLDLGRAVRVIATHFVHRFGNKIDIGTCVLRYKEVVQQIFASPDKALPAGSIRESYQRRLKIREDAGLSKKLSQELSFLHISWLMLDACDLSKNHNLSVLDAHNLLVFIWEQLGLDFLVLGQHNLAAKNKWEHELMMSSYDVLRKSVAEIGSAFISKNIFSVGDPDFLQVKETLASSPSRGLVEATIAELTTTTPDAAVLHSLARHLENFRI